MFLLFYNTFLSFFKTFQLFSFVLFYNKLIGRGLGNELINGAIWKFGDGK